MSSSGAAAAGRSSTGSSARSPRPRAAIRVALGGQAGEQRVHRVRVEPEQPHRGAGRPGDRCRTRRPAAACRGRQPGGGGHHARARPAGAARRPVARQRPHRPAGPQQRPALRPGRPAQRRRRRPRVERRVERVQVARRRRAGPRGAGRGARRSAAATSPAVASRPRRKPSSGVDDRATRAGRDRRLQPAGVRVPAGRATGRRRAAEQRGAATIGIRTGSSAGPSAARSTGSGSTTSPSMRTVNVSGSTSMRGQSRRCSGRSALPRRADVGDRRPARRRTAEPVGQPASIAAGATNASAGRGRHRAVRAEHRPRQDRLRRRDRGVGVAHLRPGDHAALDHQVRPDAEERRVPQHQVGELARPRPSRPRRRCRARPPGRSCTWRRTGGPACCRPRRRRAARRAGPSSRARSARCAGPPRRPGPSPASPSR